jgi:DNA-binding MarR family transcriptional regulator
LERHHEIEVSDVEAGVELASRCAQTSARIAANLGKTKISRLEEKLLKALRSGPLSTRDSMRHLHISSKQLDEVIRSMERMGLIQVYRDARQHGGKDRVYLALPN